MLEYKKQHGEQMLAKVPNFREDVRPEPPILETSMPLYLQAITTFDVLHRLIGHMTAHFCQRRPSELGTFAWVVDAKDPATERERHIVHLIWKRLPRINSCWRRGRASNKSRRR